jgi:hypothetical protein
MAFAQEAETRLAGKIIPDWTNVRPGEQIEACRAGRSIASGWADGVTYDGSMIWLIQEGPHGRAIFHKDDGITLLRRARE